MRNMKRIGGYLLLFVVFLVPGFIALSMNATANEVGMFYVGTLLWSLFAWNAYILLGGNRIKLSIALALTLLFPVGTAINYGAATIQAVLYFILTVAMTAVAWIGIRLVEVSEEIV